MADKISDLTAITPNVDDTDLFEISVDAGAGAFVSRKVTFKEFNDSVIKSEAVFLSDMTTDLATGTDVAYFRAPSAMEITEVRASVITAPTGANIIVDIHKNGTTIMTTNKLSIDATEKTSETATTAPGITTTTVADDDILTFDIDQVGSTVAGLGLIVRIYYTMA